MIEDDMTRSQHGCSALAPASKGRDEVTIDALRKCTMRETMHINGGKAWFGYMLVCNQHPRLSRLDKYERANKGVTSEWRVDGAACASLDEAVARLNVPPAVTDQMKADLAAIGPVFGDHRKSIAYERLQALSERGLIEWGERGKCRVVPSTRSVGESARR